MFFSDLVLIRELESESLAATLEHGPGGDQETEIFDCTQFIQTAQNKKRQIGTGSVLMHVTLRGKGNT